ncbi:PKD domain-containing protein [bacterium]|nr:MAG: PKD domain-containing protein [bacterium]
MCHTDSYSHTSANAIAYSAASFSYTSSSYSDTFTNPSDYCCLSRPQSKRYASGNAPLSVTFTGRGQAAGQSIGQYQFDFGNNDGVTGSSSVVNYTYSQPGTYKATLKVKGSLSGQSGETDACTVTIQVTGTSNQPSVTPTPKPQLYLPQTGVTGPLMTFVGALLITGGLLHVWLTSRNKLLIVPKRR